VNQSGEKNHGVENPLYLDSDMDSIVKAMESLVRPNTNSKTYTENASFFLETTDC